MTASEVPAETPHPDKSLDVATAQLIGALCTDLSGPREILTQTAMAALQLPGVCHVGITTVERGDVVHSLASTDGHPLILDRIQQRCLEGPCSESGYEGRSLRIDDLESETRWPNFAREAAVRTPIRTMLSMPIFRHLHTGTALNLYADRPAVFGADAEAIGLAFAMHAAAVI